MLLRLWVAHSEFLLKRLSMYCGACSLSDLKTIVFDSMSISCAMVFQPSCFMSGLLGVSKLLFVMITIENLADYVSCMIEEALCVSSERNKNFFVILISLNVMASITNLQLAFLAKYASAVHLVQSLTKY